jgi:hypothetical protein
MKARNAMTKINADDMLPEIETPDDLLGVAVPPAVIVAVNVTTGAPLSVVTIATVSEGPTN